MRRRLLALALAAAFGLGCTANRASDPVPGELARAADRLQGEWVLTTFVPAPPLEPMLAALLEAQLGELHVTLRQGAMGIRGVGVAGDRSYRLVEATEDGFSGVIVDRDGVEYQVTGLFRGLDLEVAAYTAPWQGKGRLRRVR
jgi:hypothetical protein